jgi:nucleoside-diphosphate-sugar epimerase
MRCFLTGATGFIGGRLAGLLVAEGHEVHALVREPVRAHALSALGVHLHRGDVTEKESMRDAMRGLDALFHLAGWYKVGVRDKSPGYPINVEGTRNVLELMRELEIPRGVYTSTVGVYSDTEGRIVDESHEHAGPWCTHYEHTKWQAHFEVALPTMQAGLPLVVVMPGLVYGPEDRGPTHDFLVDFLRRRLSVLPRRTAFSWGYVEDIARGHLQALERGTPGTCYHLAGPVHTMEEVVELLARMTGLPTPRLRPGRTTMQLFAGLMRAVGAIVPLPTMYAGETLHAIAGTTLTVTSAKAVRELGFTPRSIALGMRETVLYEANRLGMRDIAARAADVALGA